jgi:hypothetical protein
MEEREKCYSLILSRTLDYFNIEECSWVGQHLDNYV